MPIPLAGPGQGLPLPQNLFPTQLTNAPADISTNRVALQPGDSIVLPAGDWYISMGMYLVLQFLDPVTNVWQTVAGAAWTRGMQLILSDGFTSRIANLTGCVVGASIMNGGTNYVQATTTLTVIGAFQTGVAVPTLLPIVGGALASSATFSLAVPTAGNGYGIAPIIMIPPPPPAQANANGVGGIPAMAIAILGSGGSIASVSMINAGAGYPTAPVAVVVPSPFDPNLSVGITTASVSFSLFSAGAITGALVTNNGGPLINGSLGSVTISVGGAGSSGSLTANVMQTVVSASVTGGGTNFAAGVGIIATNGGAPLQGSITNSMNFQLLEFEPRMANMTAASLSGAGTVTVYDGGLFESAPNLLALGTGGSLAPTLATIMGSRPDVVLLQPAP